MRRRNLFYYDLQVSSIQSCLSPLILRLQKVQER